MTKKADIGGGIVQVATVGTKGQIVIPHKVREQFGIEPGDQVLFFSKDDSFLSIVKMDNMQQMLDQMQEFLTQTK
ncbi:MAG: AbrB/MazE/SpoVT family DNA-binding domain-containing protein [Candidatus Peribacteria bacterium]|nr:MAG: AbrB/MazE/SpoVT family DNA-binding domain-containing protein [Candidatus Peribacteria bacterium]